jgi:hypothetical protein
LPGFVRASGSIGFSRAVSASAGADPSSGAWRAGAGGPAASTWSRLEVAIAHLARELGLDALGAFAAPMWDMAGFLVGF